MPPPFSSPRGWGSTESAQGTLHPVPAAAQGRCDANVCYLWSPRGVTLRLLKGKHVGV